MIRTLAVVLAASLLAAAPTPTPKPSAKPAPPRAAAPTPAPADTGSGTSFNVGVWTVHASLLDVSFKNGDFSTPQKIVMNRAGGDITADRASGNYKSQQATLYGNVVMHDTQGNFAGLSSTSASQSRGPATLTANQVQIDGKAKVYTATGNVHYVQADSTVDADKGTLNDDTHELFLVGNVHIVQGDRNMTAERVRYNTVTGNAHAEGNVTMQFPSQISPHFATPKPITIRNPLQKKPQPSPSP